MRRLFWLFGLFLLVAGSAQAQKGETPAVEVAGGLSILRNGATAPNNSMYTGWQASLTANLRERFGITADFGGQYRSIAGTGVSQYEYLFGPQISARTERVTGFAHALFGGNSFRAPGGSLGGFAMGFGGGVDANLKHPFAIRVIQVDYIPARVNGIWYSDLRLGFGVVYKFGKTR